MHFVRSGVSWPSRYSRWCSAFGWCANWLVSINFVLLSPINALVNNIWFSNWLERVVSLIKWSTFAIGSRVGQIWRFWSDWKLGSYSVFAILNLASFEIMTTCTMCSHFCKLWSLNLLLISRSARFTLMLLLIFSECGLSSVVGLN